MCISNWVSVCVCVCVFASPRVCVWRAAWRLPVCRRFIGEADEQGRYPGAAWQRPELYLSWNDFSTPFWSTIPGAMSLPPSPLPPILSSLLSSFLCHFVIFWLSSATYSLLPSSHLSCLPLSLAGGEKVIVIQEEWRIIISECACEVISVFFNQYFYFKWLFITIIICKRKGVKGQ